ncbi:IclR family transcriptional regulator [Isoptericola haloaureus]|uniref:IclR family transcriptional regulator n=1 Tax=Isoptericola haloaureus TaxID=1542902 RepID=A0ABU7Z3R1_9MICO
MAESSGGRATKDGAVQSVDRAAAILELLATAGELGVSEIARELGVHRSTAFRLLATLEAHDLVEQEERRGTYDLGVGLLRLAGRVTRRMDIATDARAVCDDVTTEVDETSNVAILDDDAAVNITQTTSSQLVGVARQYVGQRTPLHATSTGKMLLAHAGDEVLATVLDGPLEVCTDRTITDPAALREELATIRRRGWAAAVAEWEQDTNALAVPVHGTGGRVVAALSVTAPSFRMAPEAFEEIAAVLTRHAAGLSARLGA